MKRIFGVMLDEGPQVGTLRHDLQDDDPESFCPPGRKRAALDCGRTGIAGIIKPFFRRIYPYHAYQQPVRDVFYLFRYIRRSDYTGIPLPARWFHGI